MLGVENLDVLRLDVLQAIDDLPDDEREVFGLVRVQGLTPVQAAQLNTLFDGVADANQSNGSNTTGRFRFGVPANGIVVAYYLASPITT